MFPFKILRLKWRTYWIRKSEISAEGGGAVISLGGLNHDINCYIKKTFSVEDESTQFNVFFLVAKNVNYIIKKHNDNKYKLNMLESRYNHGKNTIITFSSPNFKNKLYNS